MKLKSYVPYLLGAYSAMLSDIAGLLPCLRVDCERDYKRLLSITEQVGLPFLMIVLPDFGKHFDRCLAKGSLSPSRLPHLRAETRGGAFPKLFKGMLQRIFDENGVLKDRPCTTSIDAVRQLCYAAKRFKMSCSDSATWKQVNEFFKVEEELPPTPEFWRTGDVNAMDRDGLNFGLLLDRRVPLPGLLDREGASRDDLGGAAACAQFVADLVSTELGWYEPAESRLKHGPGAVSDRPRWVSKYIPSWWPEILESVFPIADMAYHSYSAAAADSATERLTPTFSGASKLIAVPKTLKAPRLIAAEPTSNQWCQQSILDYLYGRVWYTSLRNSVSFWSQKYNQEVALAASSSGEHATIDLSSASDRISCSLVQCAFRRNIPLLEALVATRTQFILNEIDRKHPKLHRLRKFSTMGSAVTFPVQTLLFSCIAIGALLYQEGTGLSAESVRAIGGRVRVYGDDIIVPTTSWQLTQDLLEALGLKVNHNKTFGTGKFRESCGCDAYDGIDVTPVGIISSPDVSRPGSIMSAVDTHNNFVKKLYMQTAAYIKSTVHGLHKLVIPMISIDSGAFGWHSFDGFDVHLLRRRWNEHTQQVECMVHVPYSRGERQPTLGDPMLLQYFTEVCKPPVSREERLGVASVPAVKLRRRWVPVEVLAG